MLGKIQPAFFPQVFGGGDQALDAEAVRDKFAALAAEIRRSTGDPRTPEQVAAGFVDIAVANMANAIKKISVQRGYDVTKYTLVCFGGAAGQHACLVADALGMTSVLLHPLAGVLSAYGMGLADITAMREKSVELRLEEASLSCCNGVLAELGEAAQAQVLAQGVSAQRLATIHRAHLRYEGTDSALVVDYGSASDMRARFEAAYSQRYSFLMPDKAIVIEALSVEAIGAAGAQVVGAGFVGAASRPQLGDPAPQRLVRGLEAAPTRAVRDEDAAPNEAAPTTRPAASASMFAAGEWRDTPVFRREALCPGMRIAGPAIVSDANSTTVIEPEWQADILAGGELLLTRAVARSVTYAIGTRADPVMLEVFNNLFMSIAEQMGATLANTAYSVNIKERLDFSCALFDAPGNLIANAPHMPVHLGSMGESIKTVLRKNASQMRPGDTYVLNDPYNGGTHLPDVTVVTPVFDDAGEELLFFVAARGHHADIGGLTPGSMPPASREVDEEGVLLDNFKLVEGGRMREQALRALLGGARYPARNPDQNIADLRAQIAANEKGVQELRRVVREFGIDVVRAYMQHVQDNAEEAVRRVIGVLKDGAFAYEMDNGAVVRVAIRIGADRRGAEIDFSGTSAQLADNFNAPAAVCMAAVLYVFRTLVDDDIPMNAGCLKPLKVIIPEGSMLSPRYPAATVAGNVETSQCITDALYGALGVLAAAQGTMNNFTFGNARHQYYETIGGGAGASADFDGADAVHTHMTNSRLTDPEVLEWRFPVVLERFAIRRGSGGAGRRRGGDGIVRRVRFREAMSASILANRRRVAPFGLAGGGAGQAGRSYVVRTDGSQLELGAGASVEMEPGDVFVIETPGGGGFGAPTY